MLFACILLAGCSGTLVFDADFEADTVGQPPALEPPGPPAGDSITLLAQTEMPGTGGAVNLKVEISNLAPGQAADDPNQGVILATVSDSSVEAQIVTLNFSQPVPPDGRVTAAFLVSKSSKDVVPFYAVLTGALALKMANGQFQAVNIGTGSNGDSPDELVAVLGSYAPNQAYSVLLTVDHCAHSIGFLIDETGDDDTGSGKSPINETIAMTGFKPKGYLSTPPGDVDKQKLQLFFGGFMAAPEAVRLDEIAVKIEALSCPS